MDLFLMEADGKYHQIPIGEDGKGFVQLQQARGKSSKVIVRFVEAPSFEQIPLGKKSSITFKKKKTSDFSTIHLSVEEMDRHFRFKLTDKTGTNISTATMKKIKVKKQKTVKMKKQRQTPIPKPVVKKETKEKKRVVSPPKKKKTIQPPKEKSIMGWLIFLLFILFSSALAYIILLIIG